ncbi:MAG: GNAT family protein [Pseudomonadales bacterium]
MTPTVRPLVASDLAQFRAHFDRHRAESGRGDQHFMPFAPDDPAGPRGLDVESLGRSLRDPGWQRWFVAVTGDRIVGHVNLKGDSLRTGLHRCELGIGIERACRGGGLGRRLMQVAIDFARAEPSIAWIDLRVFGHNASARGLYQSLGFTEVGKLTDRFRIDGEQIDDVIMTLAV